MRRQIIAHQSLRGLAACLVLGFHLRQGALHLQNLDGPAFLDRGYLWVDFFFILSGFIITYTAAPQGAPLSWASTRTFWWSRLTRIYPLHLFCTAALLLLSLVMLAEAQAKGLPLPDRWTAQGIGWTLQELFLVQAIGFDGFQPLNILSWSISAEMFAYVGFPLLLLAARHRVILALCLAASIGFYAWLLLAGHSLDMTQGLAPLRCYAGFTLGMALCLHRDLWLRLPDRLSDALQIGALIAIFAILSAPVSDIWVVLPFTLLVGASWTDRGAIHYLFRNRILLWLGKISYSIYLVHGVVVLSVQYAWMHSVAKWGLDPRLESWFWIATILALALPAATFTFHQVEERTRRHFKRAADRRAAARVAG